MVHIDKPPTKRIQELAELVLVNSCFEFDLENVHQKLEIAIQIKIISTYLSIVMIIFEKEF